MVRRSKDETSYSGRYRVIGRRPIIKDKDVDDDYDLTVPAKPNDKSRESMGEACLDRLEASSTSDDDGGLTDTNP